MVLMRTFTGYRPKVPEHYVEGGYGNLPDEAQFQGVEFDDGTVAVRWLTQYRSTSLWPNFAEFQAVHGHADYETRIDWADESIALEAENARLREALQDIVDASRDEGLAAMCNWMRGRAAAALGRFLEGEGQVTDG